MPYIEYKDEKEFMNELDVELMNDFNLKAKYSKLVVGMHKDNNRIILKGPRGGFFYLSSDSKNYVSPNKVNFDLNSSDSIISFLFHFSKEVSFLFEY